METLGSYTWDTTRGSPAAGRVSFAVEPVAGYANTLRVNDTDDLGNDRTTVLDNVVEGDTVYLARREGDVVFLFTAIVNGTPVNGAGFFGYPITMPNYWDERDEPADDEEVTAFRADTAEAGWPDVAELAQVLNIAPDAAVTDWLTTLDRILAAAINHVKSEVGRWDDASSLPNDNLAGAALRMAELMSQRPDASAAETSADVAFRAFMLGQRKRFGVS